MCYNCERWNMQTIARLITSWSCLTSTAQLKKERERDRTQEWKWKLVATIRINIWKFMVDPEHKFIQHVFQIYNIWTHLHNTQFRPIFSSPLVLVHAIRLICAITGSYYGCLMSIHKRQWYIFHLATPYHTYQHFWMVHDSQRWWIVLISAMKHIIF